MIDKILLFPYWLALKCRHFMYDHGLKKVRRADVPTICIGNVTVGGTGKTPHTEMIVRTLLEDNEWKDKNIAVLSRGYKRRTKGFQQVISDGSAKQFGDEPMQIKSKFPGITVAVCKSRIQGCDLLAHPEKLRTSKKARRCIDKNIPAADIIILDDAYQHRALKASASIVLIDYNRPVRKEFQQQTSSSFQSVLKTSTHGRDSNGQNQSVCQGMTAKTVTEEEKTEAYSTCSSLP